MAGFHRFIRRCGFKLDIHRLHMPRAQPMKVEGGRVLTQTAARDRA
jgi:hypothetical protein